MCDFKWFIVTVSFVWASGFVADHREFHEMAESSDAAQDKTLRYLKLVGAKDVVFHSVVPEPPQHEFYAPKPNQEKVEAAKTSEPPAMKRVSLF